MGFFYLKIARSTWFLVFMSASFFNIQADAGNNDPGSDTPLPNQPVQLVGPPPPPKKTTATVALARRAINARSAAPCHTYGTTRTDGQGHYNFLFFLGIFPPLAQLTVATAGCSPIATIPCDGSGNMVVSTATVHVTVSTPTSTTTVQQQQVTTAAITSVPTTTANNVPTLSKTTPLATTTKASDANKSTTSNNAAPTTLVTSQTTAAGVAATTTSEGLASTTTPGLTEAGSSTTAMTIESQTASMTMTTSEPAATPTPTTSSQTPEPTQTQTSSTTTVPLVPTTTALACALGCYSGVTCVLRTQMNDTVCGTTNNLSGDLIPAQPCVDCSTNTPGTWYCEVSSIAFSYGGCREV